MIRRQLSAKLPSVSEVRSSASESDSCSCRLSSKDQLNRASSSVALNLAEGSGRESDADQKRFFTIAFASLRECQSVLDLEFDEDDEIVEQADVLAAHLYQLIEYKKRVA